METPGYLHSRDALEALRGAYLGRAGFQYH